PIDWGALRPHRLFSGKVFEVLVVFAADELAGLPAWTQMDFLGNRPRPGVGARIVDGHVDFHVSIIDAPETFDYVEFIGGGPSQLVEPSLAVEAFGVDYERVSVPFAGGISHPGGVCVGIHFTAIG